MENKIASAISENIDEALNLIHVDLVSANLFNKFDK